MPFEYQPYRSDLTGTIADIMMRPAQARAQALRVSGDARARAAEASGQRAMALAGTLGGIAQGVGNQILQHQQDAPRREMEQMQLDSARDAKAAAEQEKLREAALQELFARQEPPSSDEILQIAGPERGLKIVQGLSALHDVQGQRFDSTQKRLQAVLAGMDELPEAMRAQAYPGIRQSLIEQGVIQPKDAPEGYDPSWWQRTRKYGQETKQPGTREVKVRNPDGSETVQIVEDKPGQTFNSAAPVKEPAKAGTLEFELEAEAKRLGRRVDQLTPSQRQRIKAQWEAAGRAPERPVSEPLEAIMVNGEAVLVPRSQAIGKTPATNRQRTTEDERKSVGWYQQMRDAAATIDAMEDKLTDKELYQIQSLPHEHLMGMANRNQLSENAKRYLRAFTQFSEARLRSVSGAAISTGEYQSDRQTFGKQYGETPELREDRRRAREVVISATRERAGVAMPKETPGAADLVWDPASGTFKKPGGVK